MAARWCSCDECACDECSCGCAGSPPRHGAALTAMNAPSCGGLKTIASFRFNAAIDQLFPIAIASCCLLRVYCQVEVGCYLQEAKLSRLGPLGLLPWRHAGLESCLERLKRGAGLPSVLRPLAPAFVLGRLGVFSLYSWCNLLISHRFVAPGNKLQRCG